MNTKSPPQAGKIAVSLGKHRWLRVGALMRSSIFRAILAVTLLTASAREAAAQTTEWANAGSGNWFTTSNWNGGVPAAGSIASIGNGGTAVINSAGATAAFVHVGYRSDESGSVFVTGNGRLTLGPWLAVYNGLFEVNSGARVTVAEQAGFLYGHTEIGHGGTATVRVTGSGSYLSTQALYLPYTSELVTEHGILRVENGGRVDTSSGDIFANGPDTGSAIVTGANSIWAISSTLNLGGAGAGAVISSGGTLRAGFVSIGGSSAVAVTGAGSAFTTTSATGSLQVGSGGSAATLSVQSGGTATSTNGTLGYSGGSGTVSVAGVGSSWTNSGTLYLGSDIYAGASDESTGTVNISSGGLLTTGTTIAGYNAASTGNVTVTGAGSRWNNNETLFVGRLGTGALEIRNGGAVAVGFSSYLGQEAGAVGSVLVSDPASSWTTAGNVFIGTNGYGSLQVQNGGLVSGAGHSFIGAATTALGIAIVSGAGSTWNMAGTLYIGGGFAGPGGGFGSYLTVADGGAVNAGAITLYGTGTLYLGNNTTLTGPLTVLGGVIYTFGNTSVTNSITLGSDGVSVVTNDADTNSIFSGNITGSGGLRKAGFGTGALTLTGTSDYSGETTVTIGALLVNGSITSATTVNSGGTLGGTGIVGAVQVDSGGILAPGLLNAGVGTLTTNALSLASNAKFVWELDSNLGQADRLIVTAGDVSLDANALFMPLDLGSAPLAMGATYTVIDKQSAGFASGAFQGLPEGAEFDLGENRFSISYRGGDGNDITLENLLAPIRIWDSGGTSDLGSDAANWEPDRAPVNGHSLSFGSGGRTTNYMDYASLNVKEVTFIGGAPAFTVHVPESSSSRHFTINGALTNDSANEQTLVADGATGAGLSGGVLTIASSAITGPFTLIARGPAGGGTSGGVIEFTGSADADTVRVVTEPGSLFNLSGRAGNLRLGSIEGGGFVFMGFNSLLVGWNGLDTEFSGTLSGALSAALEKHGTGRLILSGANIYFGGTTVAGGILEVRTPAGGLGSGGVSIQPGGELHFAQTAVTGGQTFTVRGASSPGPAALLRFTDTASAGAAIIINDDASSGPGGTTEFHDAASAGLSVILNRGGTFADPSGGEGSTQFFGTSTAGAARIDNLGALAPQRAGGFLGFRENSTAGTALIDNKGSVNGLWEGGHTDFTGAASAGASLIINRGATHPGGVGGFTHFGGGTTAGSARILNTPGAVAEARGGFTQIDSDAGTAIITAQGSFDSLFPATIHFAGGTAASSTLTVEGASGPGGIGGLLLFDNDATAANAAILARSGLVAGAPGGEVRFLAASDGGTARATIEAGATFDLSGLTGTSMTIGSIEGAGAFLLGSKELIAGGNDASTTVSGTIADGGLSGGAGGALTKTGAGTLTVAGVLAYTGATTVLEGTLEITTSQQLTSLDIGDGGVVLLTGGSSPAPLAGSAVPEPGVVGLFAAGVLGLLGRRPARERRFLSRRPAPKN